MGMTNSLGAALNPASVWTFARELGADYAKLVAVCVLLVALGGMSGSLWQLSWLLGVLGEMFAVWTMLALFLAIGAALRAHRFEFDLLEGVDDAEQREERERQAGLAEDARPSLRVGAQRLAGAGLSHRQRAHRQRRRQPRHLSMDFQRHARLGRPAARGACSASGSRSGSGTRAARSMRSSSRSAAASSRRASCRPPRSRPSSRLMRARARPPPPRRRARRARCRQRARLRALVRVLVAGDQPRAAAVGQVFPEPAERHEHGARHADRESRCARCPKPTTRRSRAASGTGTR